MRMKSVGILALIVTCFMGQLNAQQAREVFGQNRIQYKEFDWKYLSSENFDVHFYGERKKAAEEALQYLESEFDRITDLLGFYPYQKTKVFLYNSITDLQQSNIGLNHTRYSAGGETEFIKPYVEIAHPGNLEEFKQELIFKMSDLLVNEMMFGGSLKDMFQNSVLLNLPDWFINGTSYYVAHGWNEEMDDFVRQLVKSKKVNRALRLTDKEAALVGQSIWNYIVEKYGKSSINNILNYTRIIRDEEKSILITLGVPFKQLLTDWKSFYGGMETKVSQNYVSLSDSSRFSRNKKNLTYTTVKISPDGKKIAYAENDRGEFTVKVKSLENGKETTILTGGNRVIKQTVDYRVPLLSWSDANTLGVIGVKKGQYIFWLYDLNTRTKLPRELDKFSNIRSFNFSNNGRLVVISADFEGQNDLFLLSSRRDRTKRLTNDKFDDLDPAFVPNSNTVVFSSNRFTDSLKTNVKGLEKLAPNYNLFLYNIDTTLNKLIRITNTLSKDFHARAIDENNFYYLSDQRGIVNLFKYNSQSGIYSQVTNYNSSIKDYDINYENKMLATVLSQKLREDIFIDPKFDFDRQVFTPVSRRKEVLQARVLTERKKKETPKQATSIKDLINSRIKEKTDTISRQPVENPKKDSVNREAINTDDYTFDDVKKDTTRNPLKPTTEKALNTDDYVFEEEAVKNKQPSETFLTRYMKARETSRVLGPFPYAAKFSYENIVTSLVVDPLRGWSMRVEAQMNDMLENYRIFGGFQTAFDLKNGDVYGEFQYLPHRVDFSARFDRKVIFWQPPNREIVEEENQKYSFQKLELGASYPLSVRTRVTLKPFFGFTEFIDRGRSPLVIGPPTFRPTQTQFYTGAKLEIVYDNSITTGMNIIEGTRGKFSFMTYNAIGDSRKNFSQVSVDVRRYQKIYKEIVLAVRGFAGTFYGNSPKNYLLGGMDNWIGNSFNYSGVQNPLTSQFGQYNENLLFVEFATSLRGFDYGTLYGNSAALLNAELRIPLVRALSSGPITSNFFRNLQLTGFYDFGSSWTGPIPFDNENNGRVRIVPEKGENSPFKVEIKEYLNPWLYSYGAGFRSMIFGYYLKLDVAWPVENYAVKNPRLYVTFGFDF
ncbi:MAG: PD40 domain-containing protein [Bacteroidetes bacterium]|nr:PD40 domain-containing protein [Bacteroidota bacterium]